jgi:hypothetical protein
MGSSAYFIISELQEGGISHKRHKKDNRDFLVPFVLFVTRHPACNTEMVK